MLLALSNALFIIYDTIYYPIGFILNTALLYNINMNNI